MPNRLLATLVIALAAAASHVCARPMDIFLLIDESGSMQKGPQGGADPTGLRLDAAELYLDLSGQGDRISVIGFGEKVRGLNLTDVTLGLELVRREIRSIESSQRYTDILGALQQAAFFIERNVEKGRLQVVVLLTDGKIDPRTDVPPKYDKSTYRNDVLELSRQMGARGVLLFTIALGRDADRALLSEMAALTSASAYEANSAADLREIYSRLFIELQNRFTTMERRKPMPFVYPLSVGTTLEELTVLVFKDNRDTTARVLARGPRGYVKEAHGGMQEVPGVKYFKSYVILKVRRPEPGDWTIDVEGSGKADVLVLQDMGFVFTLDAPAEKEYLAGEPVPVKASVTATIKGVAVKGVGVATKLRRVDVGRDLPAPRLAVGPPGETLVFTGAIRQVLESGSYELHARAKDPSGRAISEKKRSFSVRSQPQLHLLLPPAPPTPADPPRKYRPGDEIPVSAEVRPATPGETYTLTAELVGRGAPRAVPLKSSPGTGAAVAAFTGQTKAPIDPGFYTVTVEGTGSTGVKLGRKDRVVTVEFRPEVKVVQPRRGEEYPFNTPIPIRLTITDILPELSGGVSLKGGTGDLPEITLGRVQPEGANRGVARGTFTTGTPGNFQVQGWAWIKTEGGTRIYRSSEQVSFAVTAPLDLNVAASAEPYASSPIKLEYQFLWGGRPVSRGEYDVVVVPPDDPTPRPVARDAAAMTLPQWQGEYTETMALGTYKVRVTARNVDIGKTVEREVDVPIVFDLVAPADAEPPLVDEKNPSLAFTVKTGLSAGEEFKVVATLSSLGRVLEDGSVETISQQLLPPTTEATGSGQGDHTVTITPPDLSLFAQATYKAAFKVDLSATVAGEVRQVSRPIEIVFRAVPPANPLWIVILAVLVLLSILLLPRIMPGMFPNFRGLEVECEGQVHDLSTLRPQKGIWFPRIGMGGTSAEVCLTQALSRPVVEIKAEFGKRYALQGARGIKVSIRGGKPKAFGYVKDGDQVKIVIDKVTVAFTVRMRKD